MLEFENKEEDLCEVFNGIFDIQVEHKQIMNKFDEAKTFLNLKKNKKIGTKHIKVCKKEKLAWTYFNIFKDAIKIMNYKKNHLQTIWDVMGI